MGLRAEAIDSSGADSTGDGEQSVCVGNTGGAGFDGPHDALVFCGCILGFRTDVDGKYDSL